MRNQTIAFDDILNEGSKGYGHVAAKYFSFFAESTPHGRVIRHFYTNRNNKAGIPKSKIANIIGKKPTDDVLTDLKGMGIITEKDNSGKYAFNNREYKQLQEAIRYLFNYKTAK